MSEKYIPETAKEEMTDLMGRANALHGYLQSRLRTGDDHVEISAVASILGFDDLSVSEKNDRQHDSAQATGNISLKDVIEEISQMTDELSENTARICILLGC